MTGGAGGGRPDPPGNRRAAALVGGGILLSRLAGLARERALSNYLGVGPAVDAFRAAVRIPNVLQNLLGEGVLSASFIPVYSRSLAEGDEEEAGRIAGAVAGLLAALAGTLVVIGVVFARPLTKVLAPGFTGERFELTVTLTRILTPGIGLLVLSAWCLGVLNSHRRFFLSYVAPVLWNVAQIVVLVALGLRGVEGGGLAKGLAWGAFVGGALQLGVQLPVVASLVRPLRLSLRTDLPGVRDVLRRFGPVVAGRGVVQLSAYVDLLLASLLAVGAVSALGYAQVFYLLPVSLFGMSVAAAELPELSRAAAAPELPGSGGTAVAVLADRLDRGLARIAFFVVGTSVAYLVLGDLVVGALLQTGEFRADDARLVWYTLGAFTLGLLATTASRLVQNALYALGDTKGPAAIAGLRVGVAAAVGGILMFQLDRVGLVGPGLDGLLLLERLPAPVAPLPVAERTDGALRLGAVGLAAASGMAAWLELALLRRRLARAGASIHLGGGTLGRLLVAATVAAGLGALLRPVATDLPPVLGLVVAGVPAGIAYVFVCQVLAVSEATSLLGEVRRRLRR
ncbi:MAG: murein biosynthesis integral membrane protein MurJ [Acidimicrobiales bacterium]